MQKKTQRGGPIALHDRILIHQYFWDTTLKRFEKRQGKGWALF
ncbi:hypothetical protein ADICYQ_4737 [Cyclobacterium qasimii M12-11B]|uniref:Uncharacterized protein n=1 Tax=Cyclobacterium qasimii M12-11B TaxID=641524 RepID=S7V7Q8_9BACT|nr:hypothetical protein ADICYQ_4737 [Cyclobacterium qasimii M12-11B]